MVFLAQRLFPTASSRSTRCTFGRLRTALPKASGTVASTIKALFQPSARTAFAISPVLAAAARGIRSSVPRRGRLGPCPSDPNP